MKSRTIEVEKSFKKFSLAPFLLGETKNLTGNLQFPVIISSQLSKIWVLNWYNIKGFYTYESLAVMWEMQSSIFPCGLELKVQIMKFLVGLLAKTFLSSSSSTQLTKMSEWQFLGDLER